MSDQKQADRRVQNELMLNELRARNNPLRLESLQNEHTFYSEVYRSKFFDAIDQGHSVQVAANLAEKKADTASALSDFGNISRPVTAYDSAETDTDEIRIAVIKKPYPTQKMQERHFNKLRKKLQEALDKLTDNMKPHFLECSYLLNFGYVRVVCADRTSAAWLESTIPKLMNWTKSPITTRPEAECRQTNAYTVILADSANDSCKQILAHFKSQNSGFNPRRWRIISQKLCDDKTTIEAVVKMPEDPDEMLLQAANYVLKYKLGTVNFTKAAIVANENKNMDRATYVVSFPDSENDSVKDVLKVLENRNESLDTSEWVRTNQKRYFKNGQSFFRIVFLVDAASDQMIRRVNKRLNYKSGKVDFVPNYLGTVDSAHRKRKYPRKR